ncbi:hypothetical protein BC643_1077 [Mangrovibacterium diazotrophicum]|uniref:Uncharacterized protein n=1 Tax=Mangrovibacterium diazotrophicum TaxID=1261403 RepID=A0A419W5L4_9BACT|nr:hypothetical protein BC643_1077 [Mangrovibacterium diazotrophicum]
MPIAKNKRRKYVNYFVLKYQRLFTYPKHSLSAQTSTPNKVTIFQCINIKIISQINQIRIKIAPVKKTTLERIDSGKQLVTYQIQRKTSLLTTKNTRKNQKSNDF